MFRIASFQQLILHIDVVQHRTVNELGESAQMASKAAADNDIWLMAGAGATSGAEGFRRTSYETCRQTSTDKQVSNPEWEDRACDFIGKQT